MKTNKLILGALAAFAMLSCAKENPVLPSQDTPLEQDEIRFVNISIGSPSSLTKAPTFDDGEEDENSVTDVQLLFFDKAGNRVGTITTINKETWENNETVNKDQGINNSNVNRYYAKATQVSLRRGENLPSYVMAFVNAISGDLTGSAFNSLSSIEKYTLEGENQKKLYTTKGFAMSNSVYYGTDAVTGVTDSKIMATPISLDQLFSTEADAQEALGVSGNNAAIVDIYVERYAAKVRFGFNIPNGIQGIVAGEKTLTFVPEAWAINADEDESYITKSFFASSGSTDAATLAQMNEALTGWNDWNDATNFRSYWAQSPNYWATDYPRVSDEITDEEEGWQENKQTDASTYRLKYYSYEEVIANSTSDNTYNRLAQTAPASTAGQAASNVLYVRENTVDSEAFSHSLNPKATVPSIVLVGKYQVDGEDVDDIFYLKGNSAEGTLKYFDEEGMYADFLANQGLLFSDASGTPLEYEDTDAENLTIEHPAKAVRGEFLTDSRYVTLQLTESAISSTNIFTYNSEGVLTPLNEVVKNAADLAALNSLLWQEVGSVRGYYKGHAYFYIPVKHLGFDALKGTQTNENPNSADFDWSEVKSGAFGLVRNHSYSVEVTNITGIASGIPSENIPIVPPLDDEDYYIAARINILNWAVVNKQEVEL